ncbi:MAG: hypothetical protein SGBAC_000468 [Bacillariaceae sp.]
MLQSIQANLPNDEANLLLSKVTDMTALVEKLLHRRKRERKQSESGVTTKKDNQLPWSWEPSIRIIMASDNIYYRLYYQQLTGMIPVASKHHDTDEGWYIPHPPFYFGLEGFTVQSKEEDAKGTSNKTKSIIPVLMQSAQELKDSSPELQALLDHLVVGTTNSKDPANHALEAIHRQRFQETMLLFQDRGWASSARSLPQWNTSLSLPVDPESKHETPAPHLLMEWRDSCRDFLCHLYAYATVSSKVLCQLVDLLAQLQKEESMDLSKGIVEIGAGTGYLAETLRAHGVAVQAWDIQPTSVKSVGDNSGGMNEYHGHVPPFCDVYKASTFPSTSHADRSALLLCYPPPESPMALNTLSAYRKAGGQCLIHIGEFKGLTGDSKFEKVLRKGDMHCVARYPCLGWGTDAAYVSVWIAKGSNPKILASSKVLLPCSAAFCSKEAKHRCRPLRQVYNKVSLMGAKKVTFDETNPGEPAEFVVGKGQVIKGFDIGVCGDSNLDIPAMKIGGDRKLMIPAELAYGERGAGDAIPPNTDLEFQISILSAASKEGLSKDVLLKGFAGLGGFLVFMAGFGYLLVQFVFLKH